MPSMVRARVHWPGRKVTSQVPAAMMNTLSADSTTPLVKRDTSEYRRTAMAVMQADLHRPAHDVRDIRAIDVALQLDSRTHADSMDWGTETT